MPISINIEKDPTLSKVVSTAEGYTVPDEPITSCGGATEVERIQLALKEAKAAGYPRSFAVSVAAIAKNETGFNFKVKKPKGSLACCDCVLPVGIEPISTRPEWQQFIGRVMPYDVDPGFLAEIEGLKLVQRVVRTTEKGTATYFHTVPGRTRCLGLADGNQLLLERAIAWKSMPFLRVFAFGPAQRNIIFTKMLGGSSAHPDSIGELWGYYVSGNFGKYMQLVDYLSTTDTPADHPDDDGRNISWLQKQVGDLARTSEIYFSTYKAALKKTLEVAKSVY